MSRATNKEELIASANEGFAKMQKLVGSLTETARQATFDFGDAYKGKEAHWERDKNLRDVFVHLYEWHELLLKWVSANMSGEARPFLPPPYDWKTYGGMNVGFWQKHQSTPYAEAERLLAESHGKVMALIESFTNDELFEKKHFPWTGTTSLGAYCISTTASHYDWAIKKIKAHIKTLSK